MAPLSISEPRETYFEDGGYKMAELGKWENTWNPLELIPGSWDSGCNSNDDS